MFSHNCLKNIILSLCRHHFVFKFGINIALKIVAKKSMRTSSVLNGFASFTIAFSIALNVTL